MQELENQWAIKNYLQSGLILSTLQI
jgi:hypothetical protein